LIFLALLITVTVLYLLHRFSCPRVYLFNS